MHCPYYNAATYIANHQPLVIMDNNEEEAYAYQAEYLNRMAEDDPELKENFDELSNSLDEAIQLTVACGAVMYGQRMTMNRDWVREQGVDAVVDESWEQVRSHVLEVLGNEKWRFAVDKYQDFFYLNLFSAIQRTIDLVEDWPLDDIPDAEEFSKGEVEIRDLFGGDMPGGIDV